MHVKELVNFTGKGENDDEESILGWHHGICGTE